MRKSARRRWVIAYLMTTAVLWSGGFVLIAWPSPGLITERTRPGPGTLEGYGQETALYALPSLAHWVLAAVDRPGSVWWRPTPTTLHALGLLAYP